MRIVKYSLLFAAIAVSSLCRAAEPQHSDGLASVAPLINEQTLAVVCVDLSRIDLAAFQKQIIDPACRSDAERKSAADGLQTAKQWIGKLVADGATRAYVILSPEQIFPEAKSVEQFLVSSTVVAIPGLKPQTMSDLQRAIQDSKTPVPLPIPGGQGKMGPDMQTISGIAVIGEQGALDRLQHAKPEARPEFEKALAAGGDRPITAAIVPPKLFARAAEEILRDPVPGVDKLIGPIISHGCLWFGIGIETNLDKFSAEAVIQSASADAAKTLGDALKQSVAKLLADQLFQSNTPSESVLVSMPALALLPEVRGDQLVLSLTGERAAALSAIAQQLYRLQMSVSYRQISMTNMKQLGLSILNYEDKYHQLPDHAIRDKNDKPLLSWRVAMLPELEETALFKEFHLDEPWDSEHNKKLIDRMPDVFRSADSATQHPGKTRYLAVVGKDTAFPTDGPIMLKDVTDGTSKTIWLVEADPEHAVVWTKPDDLEVDLDHPLRGLGSPTEGFNGALIDGSVRYYKGTINPKILRALFTRNGGEIVNWEDIDK